MTFVILSDRHDVGGLAWSEKFGVGEPQCLPGFFGILENAAAQFVYYVTVKHPERGATGRRESNVFRYVSIIHE
jgi:hypothetical protein